MLRDLSTVSTSFPSTHSASAAALAVVVGGLEPRLRGAAWCFALLVGGGAIYSGGHYPLDVAAGYAVGILLGWVLQQAGRWLAVNIWRGRMEPVGKSGAGSSQG